MNDTENLAPLSLHDNLPTNPQKPLTRKPLSQKAAKPSQKPRRRALGDITNSAHRPLQPLQKQKPDSKKLQAWNDREAVPEPDIIPPAPPARPYEPAPLFTAAEMAAMRAELDDDDDDDTDDFGRPFMTSDPIPIPSPPYVEETDDDTIPRRDLPGDYFSADQLFAKDELPVLELV